MSANAKQKRTFGEWLRGYTGQKYLTTFFFLLIPIVLLLLFTLIPAVNMVLFSFQKRDQLGINPEWIGLENYITLFTQSEYLSTFKNCMYYLLGSFVQQALALLIATTLCSKLKLANVFKGILFFPYMMNGVAVSIIFRKFFAKGDGIISSEGTLNSILSLFGIQGTAWLNNPDLVNWCLVFASIWKYIGFDIIMYIGAIQSISPDIYEAADLDGANGWQRFWYIVFPGIRPIVALQLVLAIKGAASVFDIPYIITGGANGTSTFVIKTIDTAFTYEKVGLGSAMGIVLLLIILIITGIQNLFFRERK